MRSVLWAWGARLLAAAAVALSAGCGGAYDAYDAYKESKRGGERYAQKAYAAAAERFERAARSSKRGSEAEIRSRHNAGTALLAAGRAETAAGPLRYAADSPDGTPPYNLGNAYFRQRRYDLAARAYVEHLKRHPDDLDAKHNLELALERLEAESPSRSDREGGGGEENESGREPRPQEGSGGGRQEAELLLDMFGQDGQAQQARRLRQLSGRRAQYAEKDW